MRLTLTGILITALLIGASCSKPAAAPAREGEKTTLEPILGSIDAPLKDSVLKDTVTAGGWAVAESGVQRIAIYIDQQFVAYATLGGGRPDIAKAFANFPDAATSGWNVVIDLTRFPEGDHQIVMQVQSKTGHTHDSAAVPFKIR